MILDNLKIENKLNGNFFYFAADSKYLDLYGKALALSLQEQAPWATIHIHIYNPTDEQKSWCKERNVSFSEEEVNINHPEFRTLCACLRFIRVPEIFNDYSRIISFDCDVLANNKIPKEKFLDSTNSSAVTIRKGNKTLASAISFGLDNFRHEYSTRLKENFEKDNIYWFLDQHVLDQMNVEGKIKQLNPEWTSTKMTPDRMIWTAKGNRKTEKVQYVDLLNYYNSIS